MQADGPKVQFGSALQNQAERFHGYFRVFENMLRTSLSLS